MSVPTNPSFGSVGPKTLWTYWDNPPGKRRPAYLDLCMGTIRKNLGDYELVLLDEKTVGDYIDVPAKVRNFKFIAHKADYYRFHLLYKFGGAWLDSDVIMFRDLNQAIDPHTEKFDYIGFGDKPGEPSIGFMAATPQSQLLARHIEAMDHLLSSQRSWFGRKLRLGWTDIGAHMLWKFSRDYPYFHHRMEDFAPIGWEEWERFFSREEDESKILAANPFAIMLYNKNMGPALANVSAEEVLKADNLLGALFRKALQ